MSPETNKIIAGLISKEFYALENTPWTFDKAKSLIQAAQELNLTELANQLIIDL